MLCRVVVVAVVGFIVVTLDNGCLLVVDVVLMVPMVVIGVVVFVVAVIELPVVDVADVLVIVGVV